MVTIAILMVIALIASVIWAFEKFKQEKFIATAIDKNTKSPDFITPDTQAVIDTLRQPELLKLVQYRGTIKLPDYQEISYKTKSIESFKAGSKLNYEPTPKEWEILRGIVKKLYSHL